MPSSLKVIQINAQRSSVVVAQLNQLIRNLNIELLLIQEPFFAYRNVRGFPINYLLMKPACETPMVAAICGKELDPIIMMQFTDSHILVLSIRFARCTIFVINVY